ncbi:MAG: DUF1460 domain-containing protein [Legionellales bacterium]|nr:DUF1460 domain-containing protein [Legionellales bacterium]
MQKLITLFLSLLVCLLSINSAWAFAVPIQIIPEYNMKKYDSVINQIYQNPASHSQNLVTRINFDSAYFLGKSYLMFPTGEGPDAYFDKNPLYRTDVFDCMTYVNTVMALAYSNNLTEFQKTLKQLSYANGEVMFLTRHHFVTGDWNESNTQMGYVQDITTQLKTANNISPVRYADTIINKPNWYRMMSPERIRVFFYPGDKQAKQLLSALRDQSSEVSAVKISTPYIPMSAFLTSSGQPDMTLFKQIPSGAVVEIVRPNWDLTRYIGTHLNVSHLGFAIRTSQGLMFREASMDKKQVVDIPFASYIQSLNELDPTEGVNILNTHEFSVF